MKAAGLLLAVLLCAGMGAATSFGLAWAGQRYLRPTVLLEQQPMLIRFKDTMSATMQPVVVERMKVQGRIDTVVPFRQDLRVPLRGDYRVHVDFDHEVPVRMTIRHTVRVPIRTVADIEAATTFVYGGTKQYRNVGFRAKLPLQFEIDVPLEIEVDTMARVSGSAPMTATLNQDLRFWLDERLHTQLDLDNDFKRPLMGRMRVTLQPDPVPVRIMVTHAQLHWPASP